MLSFLSDGIRLAFIDENLEATRSLPVLLIHGFASNTDINWIATGWVGELRAAGYRVLALDNRGHGKSDKLYEPE
ncbi:MAG: alpha/beta fold hydrolase, partial [Hyphomicrobium sp.]